MKNTSSLVLALAITSLAASISFAAPASKGTPYVCGSLNSTNQPVTAAPSTSQTMSGQPYTRGLPNSTSNSAISPATRAVCGRMVVQNPAFKWTTTIDCASAMAAGDVACMTHCGG